MLYQVAVASLLGRHHCKPISELGCCYQASKTPGNFRVPVIQVGKKELIKLLELSLCDLITHREPRKINDKHQQGQSGVAGCPGQSNLCAKGSSGGV